MNDLQKLIKIRGLTVLAISCKIGHGYHMTQKVIKGVRYKRQDGSFVTRSSLPIENAVAAQLGLKHDQAWGPKSRLVLRRLIQKEIKDQAKEHERNLQRQFLTNTNTNNRIAENKAAGNV